MSRAKWIEKNYPKAATPQPLLLCFPSSDSKIRTNSGCRQTVQKTCSAQGMSNLRVLSGRVSWYDVTEEDFCLPPALLSALSCPVCTPCFMSQSEVLVLVCQEQTRLRENYIAEHYRLLLKTPADGSIGTRHAFLLQTSA